MASFSELVPVRPTPAPITFRDIKFSSASNSNGLNRQARLAHAINDHVEAWTTAKRQPLVL
jgi:hypothetical protein